MTDLQYPIGKFVEDPDVTPAKRQGWIEEVIAAPGALRRAVEGLTPEQLDTPYRPGGWTVRQVVHHLADSHLHTYLRFKLALTESEPAITGYDTDAWAELPDAKAGAIRASLAMLDAIHERWVLVLRNMVPADFARSFRRPNGQVVTLDRALQVYAWHGRHHVAHITSLRERRG